MHCRWPPFRIYYRTEFPLAFALAVQEADIRLRHIKPHRPEQTGKVERSHRIDEEEFWSRATFDGFTSASQALRAWEHQYNHDRFSMALQGLTPLRNRSVSGVHFFLCRNRQIESEAR